MYDLICTRTSFNAIFWLLLLSCIALVVPCHRGCRKNWVYGLCLVAPPVGAVIAATQPRRPFVRMPNWAATILILELVALYWGRIICGN